MTVLKSLGVDTNTFSGQSTKSASNSKAKAVEVSTIEILKRGHWSNSQLLRGFTKKQKIVEANFWLIFKKSFKRRSSKQSLSFSN